MRDPDPSQLSQADEDAMDEAETAEAPRAVVQPFNPSRLSWQIALDRLLRASVIAGVLAVLLWVSDPNHASTFALVLAAVLGIGAWMLLNGISARTSALLPRLTAMIEDEPENAEDQIAWHLKRKPLVKWVRMLLYHRLALLRHHQQRYDEAATICHTLLNHRMGPAESTRRHVLLLLAEVQLERRDAWGAYPPIAALHQAELSLLESLQRLALQTRYELLAGLADRALWQHDHKRLLSELMPAAHCGAVHAMLATAADRLDRRELAQWLWQRVRLLSTPEQRRQFEQGQFSIGLTPAASDETSDAA